MENESIIIYSSDDWGWKTSKYQLSIRFAKKNTVLFVSSIGFRVPTASREDFGRIFRKLKSFCKGLREVEKNLYVLTPIVFPYHHIRIISLFNRLVLILQIAYAKARIGITDPYVFVFSQNWYNYVRNIKRKKIIYYCVDDQSSFKGLNQKMFASLDQLMCERADVIFCSARSLVEKKKKLNPATYYMPHGVNYDLFSKVIFDPSFEVASDVKDFSKPVFGFWGHISYDWVDADLLKYIAKNQPNWTLLLIGRNSMRPDEFQGYDNIHLIGERNFDSLPGYCRIIDVGLIPFVDSTLTYNCNPLKLYEYMAAGLPVVSTDIPEARFFGDKICIAKNKQEFLECCESALELKTNSWHEEMSLTMKENTWDRKVEEIYQLIIS